MKAVILAAGMGTRLGRITKNCPKCLLEINGKSIIEYQVEALYHNNIDEIIIVTGFQAEKVKKKLGNKVSYINNPVFSETNSSYSLWLAKDYIYNGWLHMNCDLIFSEKILQKIMAAEKDNSIVIDLDIKPEDDQEKVRIVNGRITEMSKTMPFEKADGKTIGMAHFSQNGAEAVLKQLDKVIKSGERNRWFFSIISDVMDNKYFKPISTDGNFWAEIDTPDDFSRACEMLA